MKSAVLHQHTLLNIKRADQEQSAIFIVPVKEFTDRFLPFPWVLLTLVFFPLPQKHGLVIIPDGTPNGDVNHEPVVGAITIVSQEAAQVLESAGEGPLGKVYKEQFFLKLR